MVPAWAQPKRARKVKQKTVFVTGGGSGLGAELVRAAYSRGYHVLCTGRRPMADLPADFPDVPYFSCDLASARGAADTSDWLRSQLHERQLDCAFLNAAAGYFRPLGSETPEAICEVLTLNLDANIVLAHRLSDKLDGGSLALIGSVAHKGAAGMPVYSASKAALDGFGRALAEEWRGRVAVRVLHPGPIATGMSARAGRKVDLADRLFLSPRLMARMILDAGLARRGRDRQVIAYLRALRSQILPFNRRVA